MAALDRVRRDGLGGHDQGPGRCGAANFIDATLVDIAARTEGSNREVSRGAGSAAHHSDSGTVVYCDDATRARVRRLLLRRRKYPTGAIHPTTVTPELSTSIFQCLRSDAALVVPPAPFLTWREAPRNPARSFCVVAAGVTVVVFRVRARIDSVRAAGSSFPGRADSRRTGVMRMAGGRFAGGAAAARFANTYRERADARAVGSGRDNRGDRGSAISYSV